MLCISSSLSHLTIGPLDSIRPDNITSKQYMMSPNTNNTRVTIANAATNDAVSRSGTDHSNNSGGSTPAGLTERKNMKTATGLDSEGGHELRKIRPMTKHSGQSVVTFFTGLYQTIIAISTLGTSVTFSFILSAHKVQNGGKEFKQHSISFSDIWIQELC